MPGNRRGVAAAVMVLVGVLTVSGCGASPTTAPAATTSPGGQAASAGTGPVPAGSEWGHVHNLTLDGDRLLLGTHEGLWQQSPGQPARLLSDPPFDVMGFALSGRQMLASGHPGEGPRPARRPGAAPVHRRRHDLGQRVAGGRGGLPPAALRRGCRPRAVRARRPAAALDRRRPHLDRPGDPGAVRPRPGPGRRRSRRRHHRTRTGREHRRRGHVRRPSPVRRCWRCWHGRRRRCTGWRPMVSCTPPPTGARPGR